MALWGGRGGGGRHMTALTGRENERMLQDQSPVLPEKGL